MAVNDYVFITKWRAESTCEEVYAILDNAADLPRWWPEVYLKVDEIEPGDADGVGKGFKLLTKGWLPYTIAWQFRVTEKRPPHGFTISATGDFLGTGIWTFAADGPMVDITFDWRLTGEKPLFRWFSFLLKPLFSANHRWAMARGLESLNREIARRHATTQARIPAAP